MAKKPKLHLSGDPVADKLLSTDAFALLVGMVLDQQIPLERAFHSPYELNERIGRTADAALVAAMDPEQLAAAFRTPPALHRFPGSMAGRVQELARLIVADYGGDAAKIWKTAKTGTELLKRIEALPGFGKQKAKIFLGLLGKQLGVTPDGWQEASAPFGEPGSRLSIADIDSAETLAAVRDHKRQMKAAAKAGAASASAKRAAPARAAATKAEAAPAKAKRSGTASTAKAAAAQRPAARSRAASAKNAAAK